MHKILDSRTSFLDIYLSNDAFIHQSSPKIVTIKYQLLINTIIVIDSA